MAVGDPFSIVTPNRDRLSSLLQVVPSWGRCPQVAEIVVVDLGSRIPITLDHFASADKIRIVRVVNADCWRIGLAINLGTDAARCERICKLDSDIEICDPAFLEGVDLRAAFYRGRAGTAVSNGQAVFAKEHWAAVGGYNEWLSGYGFDDSDFYTRLRQHGVGERTLEPGCLTEHAHCNELRAATDLKSEFFALRFPNPDTRLLYLLSRNTYLGMLRRWSSALRLAYTRTLLPDGTSVVELAAMPDEYRWADALASLLAVVRISGTTDNVSLLNGIVARYVDETGGL